MPIRFHSTYRRVEILPQGHGGAYDCSHVENAPEDTDIGAFLRFCTVAEHHRAFSGPQESGGDAEQGTRGNDEPASARVDIDRTSRVIR
jgi:hypothetical protein